MPVALVTGASRGVGRHTALELARQGWDVAISARTLSEGDGRVSSKDGSAQLEVEGSLERTASEITAIGTRALPLVMDLLDLNSVRGFAATVIESWGRIDLLVNNAIVHLPGAHRRIGDLGLDVVLDTLRGNFVSQLALVQAVLPTMIAQGSGTIVNMASGSATMDPPAPPDEGGWSAAYAASKAALGRIAGAVNAEHLAKGIRCFNVDPGFVITESMQARGTGTAIAEKGFDSASASAAGRVIAWLATHQEADEYLGKVIWSPKLAASLAHL